MGCRWPYSCCFQDLFNIACNILVLLQSSFLCIRLVSVHVVHPYSCTDTTTALILSVTSEFHMTDSLSQVAPAFARFVLISFLVDETLLPRSVNFSTIFRELPFSVEMSPVWLKHMYSVLCALTCKPMPAATRCRLWSRVSAWAGAFARSAMSSA